MVSPRRLVLIACALSLAATACFDVRREQPGILVDDFEDGDDQPAGPMGFGPWVFFTFPSDTQGGELKVATTTSGQHDLEVRLDLADPADGQVQYGGGGVGLYAIPGVTPPVDLSGYTQLRARAWLDFVDSPLPDGAYLDIVFGCSSASGRDGGASGVSTHQRAPGQVKSGWTSFQLDLFAFSTSDQAPVDVNYNRNCLSRVDGISFIVEPILADGQSATGTLHLDDIMFVDTPNR